MYKTQQRTSMIAQLQGALDSAEQLTRASARLVNGAGA